MKRTEKRKPEPIPVKQYAYRTEFILKNREHISKEERLGLWHFWRNRERMSLRSAARRD